MDPIYLDNNATTPLAPEVRAAMAACLAETFGNPSSSHRFGEAARQVVDEARERVAALVGAHPRRTIFTSGGSEANNMAIMSAVAGRPDRRHLVSSTVEHPSVLAPLRALAERGYRLTLLEVDGDGGLDLDRLAAVLDADTVLVSLMAANNETGVRWDIGAIGELCRQRGVLFHTDAVQLAGKAAVDLGSLPVDYLTLGAHKIHGPKGCGALCAARNAPLAPLVRGAGQEFGLRAGTENVPGIVGFGVAAELARAGLANYGDRVGGLRDRLEAEILRRIPEVRINGRGQPRLANTANVSFRGVAAAAVLQELDEHGIAVSAHAACHGGDLDPSHVLTAMRVPEDYIHGTMRISLSRYTTEEEIGRFLDLLPVLVDRSRRTAAV